MNKTELKAFIMDVDGTLTDGKIYIGSKGEVCKAFSVKDGYGIKNIIIPSGIIPVVITQRKSKIVEERCKELGIIEIYQGVHNKVFILNKVLEKLGFKLSEVAYIGDDLNDISCMEIIKKAEGVVGCPSDAVMQVKQISDYCCIATGGNGAVREYIDWIMEETRGRRGEI